MSGDLVRLARPGELAARHLREVAGEGGVGSSVPVAEPAPEATLAHPIAEAAEDRLAVNRFGLRLFIASESMLFAALVASRFYLAGLERPEGVNLGLGVALTAILLGSSWLGYRGLAAIRRGDRGAAARRLGGAILLGLAFLVGVGVEWATAEFSIGTAYGTAFFATTGLHAAHLASGIVVLAALVNLLRLGRFDAEAHWGVAAGVAYWTFVDAVWVLAVFPSLYLL
ncbi:MAG TPA: cytochrome c oxidase subunit 3 [Candidatus Binatia bacterium]|nr:cytochrome c oxidase subunit 3 [Candidatus Binatia bacterium]